MSNTAVFFDRDGTLVRDPGYLTHPDQVELLDGAAEAVREVQLLGYKTVVVSNQPGVARGIITEEMLEQVHQRLRDLLSGKGASLDGIYYCPYHPDGSIPRYRQDSDWRKPRPGMLLAAATELDIDLAKSWMIGDNLRDVEAGRSAGCRTILISSAQTGAETTDKNKPDHVAVNMKEAVNIIKKYRRSGQEGHPMPAFADGNEAADAKSDSSPPHETPDRLEREPIMTANRRPQPSAATEQLLADILEQLKRIQKAETFDEFSMLRLLAGAVQVFVPFCLLVALWLLMSGDQQRGNIFVALGFAVVLQVMAMTFYSMNGRR
jgi:D-glycero-D-manno-heptose 1,7-bisphosphate phosphatase